ncbi:MAG TPA: O-antigen ligase family protein [Anaerolineales bacterium]|nr:O-antigen ligase family protein [Anaerolineales bacterium]
MRKYAFWLSLVLIFMMPWEGVFRLPGLGTATKLAGFGVAAFWLATVVITNQIRKPTPFHMMVGLFVLWNALSVFWSGNINRTVSQLTTWAQLLLLVFILWDLYTTKTALLAGLQAYVLGAYVAVGSAIANYSAGNSFYTNYERFSAGDTNPDGFGFLVALGIPVAWYLAGSRLKTQWSALLKFVNYAYIPAALFGLSLSGTRTALIATAVSMVFGLASLTRIRPWIRVVFILPFLILAILLMLPHVQTLKSFERFGTISTELAEGDLNERLILWGDGYSSFLEHPLLGVGSNMYRKVNSLGKVAHNSYLSVLVEVGLVGFALFGIILTMAVIQAWRHRRWDAAFWLTILLVWAIGASSLTWEARKTTWLFLSLITVSSALTHRRGVAVPLVKRNDSDAQVVPHTEPGNLLPGGKEKPYFV